MDQARKNIREALASSASPAVLCSFGKDSLLVLALVREVRQDVPVLWFRTGQDERFAKRIIREWGLTAFSWRPADVFLLTNGEDTTLVHEYSFGEHLLPVLQDIRPGGPCALRLSLSRTPRLFLPFDLLFVGWKDTDTHWVKGDTPLREDGFKAGLATVIAPIRHLSDEQVRQAIYELKIPYEPGEQDIPLCTACMTTRADEVFCPELNRNIPVQQWEADKSLTAFRQRYQLEGS